MTINFDLSSSREAIHLLERMERKEFLSRSLWKSLYKTEGYRILLENRVIGKEAIREYLTGNGDFPETSQWQNKLHALSVRNEEAAGRLGSLFQEWLPEELTSARPTVAIVPYGGEGEDTDPAVFDLMQACSVNQEEWEHLLLRRILVLIIRPYQNLEKSYLKNILPIRRHMGFIAVLWDIQNAGLASLMEGQISSGDGAEDEKGEVLARMDAILTEAAGSDRKSLEELGRRFREEISPEEAGFLVYSALFETAGREALRDSLARPTSPYLLLRKAGRPLFSGEGEFFLDQLDSLLS